MKSASSLSKEFSIDLSRLFIGQFSAWQSAVLAPNLLPRQGKRAVADRGSRVTLFSVRKSLTVFSSLVRLCVIHLLQALC